MPIDPSRIPALEEELRQAQNTKPGGQEPRPERIAAIEEELRIHRKARGDKVARKPKDETAPADELETAEASDVPEETADAPKPKTRAR